MKNTLRNVATMYAVTALWFAVMVAVAFSAIALIDSSGLLVEAGATVRAGLAMGIAMLVASLTAGTLWIKLRTKAAPSQTEQQPLGDSLRSLRVGHTI